MLLFGHKCEVKGDILKVHCIVFAILSINKGRIMEYYGMVAYHLCPIVLLANKKK